MNFNQRCSEMFKWAQQKENKQPTIAGHIVITIGGLVVICSLYFGLACFAYYKAGEWLPQITKNGKNDKNCSDTFNNVTAIKQNIPGIKDIQRIRLQEQCQNIASLIESHKTVMVFLYVRVYTSMMTRIILVILSGGCIFFISKRGWEKANNFWINIFILTSITSLFLTQWSLVFKEHDNLEANRTLYLAYSKLYNELLSYPSTNLILKYPENIQAKNTEKEITTSIFIHDIDSRIAELKTVPLDWDSNQIITIQDVSKQLGTNSGTQKQ